MKHYRGYAEREADRLAKGDKVWVVEGIYVNEAEVVADRPSGFSTYEVAKPSWAPMRCHRSDLFRRPAELSELVDRVEADHEALTDSLKEFRDALARAEDRRNEEACDEADLLCKRLMATDAWLQREQLDTDLPTRVAFVHTLVDDQGSTPQVCEIAEEWLLDELERDVLRALQHAAAKTVTE